MVHDSARQGLKVPSGIGFNRASCRKYRTTCEGISELLVAGSSQSAERPQCMACFNVPAGGAACTSLAPPLNTPPMAKIPTMTRIQMHLGFMVPFVRCFIHSSFYGFGVVKPPSHKTNLSPMELFCFCEITPLPTKSQNDLSHPNSN